MLTSYRALPAFAAVENGLNRLKAAKYRLYTFSKGRADAVETLLQAVGVRDLFDGVVSVDEIQSFKPDPAQSTAIY